MNPEVFSYKGTFPEINNTSWIAPNAIIVGDVTIGTESSVWYNCVVRGDVNDIRIGDRTNIQDGTVIHVSSTLQGTYIGNDVTVGHMALLHACEIKDGAFIGMKACIMDGAVVEAGAMVAAGALVTPNKTIPSGQLWGGVPAKYMRDLSEEERGYLQHSSSHYVNIMKQYRDCKDD